LLINRLQKMNISGKRLAIVGICEDALLKYIQLVQSAMYSYLHTHHTPDLRMQISGFICQGFDNRKMV
jgi:hypothetical protein